MKVLIGCEESQIVTRAFRKRGHEAYSCDLVETRGNPDWHFQADVMDIIPIRYWDLIILHPDCTAMAVSGNGTYGLNKDGTPKKDHHKRVAAIDWTVKLWMLAKKYSKSVGLENPKSVIFPVLRKLGANIQYIQPYQFGHPETKATGFALHNLDTLKETDNVYDEMMKLPPKERHKVWYASPSINRKRDRSETYQGIANAMADQWGVYL